VDFARLWNGFSTIQIIPLACSPSEMWSPNVPPSVLPQMGGKFVCMEEKKSGVKISQS
jgi:hypothetical protein